MLKDLKIDLQLDGFVDFPFSGNYFYVEASNGLVVVELLGDDSNSSVVVSASEGALFENITYSSFRIKNAFTGVNNLKVVYGFGRYQATGTKIVGTVKTENLIGFGSLFKTINLEGIETKIIDYDAGRLSVRLQNLSNEVVQIGKSDVSQNYYELQSGEILPIEKSPILAIYAIGNGRLSIFAEYKEQQDVIEPQPLEDVNGILEDANGALLSY